MTDTLHILLDEGAEPWWQVRDRAGNGLGLPCRAPLAEAATHAVGRTTVLLVPGEHVLSLAASVPTRKREHLAQALAGALEERLAEDIDDLHFAAGPGGADGSVAVAVARRADLDAWLADLAAVGLVPQRIVPDYLALPQAPDTWHALVLGERVLVRTDTARGLTVQAALLEEVLTDLLGQPPPRFVVHGVADDALVARVVRGAEAAGCAVEVQHLTPLEAVGLLASGAAAARLDLRQGAYRATRALGADLRRWRWPLALAAVALLLFTLHAALSAWRLASESARLDTELRTAFRAVLPGIEDPGIARLELENRLARLDGGGARRTLDELARITTALRAEGVSLEALDYSAGRWTLEVEAADVDALEARRAAVAAALGRPVALAGAERADDVASARLVVEPGP